MDEYMPMHESLRKSRRRSDKRGPGLLLIKAE